MNKIIKLCGQCFHSEVCSDVFKEAQRVREKLLEKNSPQCEHYIHNKVVEISEKSYVDRDAFYDKLNSLSKGKYGDYSKAINDCMDALTYFLTANVRVVRDCEECENFGKQNVEYPCSHCCNCYTDKFKEAENKEIEHEISI